MYNTEEAKSVLRPYQEEVYRRMVREKRHLNYMDMGMGKTLVTLLSVMELEAFPCIIVCPKSAMGVMEAELANWFDAPSIMYVGTPTQRDKLWKEFVVEGHKFIITNYSLVEELGQRFKLIPGEPKRGSSKRGSMNDIPPHPGTAKWKVGALVADEIQLGGLFNHKTKTYKIFNKLAKAIPNVFLLTGTPYRRGVVDFFGPLSLVNPDKFKSYWSYVNTFCRVTNTGFGKEIERIPADIPRFRKMLREYASIMKKEDYLHDLPGKTRQPIPVEMDKEQAKIYKELTEELFALTDDGELIMTPSVLALTVRQRQLLACPQELGLKTRGAAIDTMLDMSEDLVGEAKPFVIFTPFRKAVSWIRQALREKYPGIGIHEITGGLTQREFAEQWQSFQDTTKRGPRVLICVIKSGASFHATVADTAFFIGYEWDFNQNAQAEDRLNRIGQKNAVTCYYLMHKDTIDEDIAQRLNDKKHTGDFVLSDEDTFKMMIGKIRQK